MMPTAPYEKFGFIQIGQQGEIEVTWIEVRDK